MAGTVTDTDAGYKALFRRLEDAKGLVLTVGVHGPEGAAEHAVEEGEPPLTVADVATIHEYGLGNNPERSFIRAWADENKSQNEQTLLKIGQACVRGRYDATTGLNRAGLLFVAQIQRRIRAGIAPPLSPVTIARKGSSTPLINTGQLWTSIRHKVGKDDGTE
jgi:hypothetical protein